MTIAFKEWAIVIDALGRGEQIFILRKGGIHEGRGGFRPEHSQFLLFPTLFHQQRESVIAPAQSRFDEIAPGFPTAGTVRIEFWAEMVDSCRVEDFDAVRHLDGQHVWKEELLKERFEWGRERAIYALALRVHRLAVAASIPALPQYAGCKSWVELAEPLHVAPQPVLDEAAFAEKLGTLQRVLQAPT